MFLHKTLSFRADSLIHLLVQTKQRNTDKNHSPIQKKFNGKIAIFIYFLLNFHQKTVLFRPHSQNHHFSKQIRRTRMKITHIKCQITYITQFL